MRALALLAVTATAHADTITTQPLAVIGRGASLGYERTVAPRWSVLGLVGARAAAEGDYSSRTMTAGVELRWWLRRPQRNLYLAAHASAGHTRVVDEMIDAAIGSNVELTERIDVGWRWGWRSLAFTPSLGIGDHQDIDPRGRLALVHSPTVMLGFELGWRLQ